MPPSGETSAMILETVRQHVTPETGWIPVLVIGVTGLAGLVLMAKGARLAPALAAALFGLVGAVAGGLLPRFVGTPFWPTVAVSGVVAAILGVLLFRVWMAILVAACLVVPALGFYGGRVLREPVNAYLAAGLDRQNRLVTLPDAPAQHPNWQAELSGLWAHLSQTVPSFQVSVFAITISTALAGVIFGLLLPKLARAFWAASFGTLLVMLAFGAVAELYWPTASPWLQRWGLPAATAVWALALLWNFADIQGLRPKKAAAPAGGGAAGKPAAA